MRRRPLGAGGSPHSPRAAIALSGREGMRQDRSLPLALKKNDAPERGADLPSRLNVPRHRLTDTPVGSGDRPPSSKRIGGDRACCRERPTWTGSVGAPLWSETAPLPPAGFAFIHDLHHPNAHPKRVLLGLVVRIPACHTDSASSQVAGVRFPEREIIFAFFSFLPVAVT